MLQNQIYNSRIRNLSPITENHLIGKTVYVSTKKGTVTRKTGENATGEIYEVSFEDGGIGTYSSVELEMSVENTILDESQILATEDGDEEYEKFFRSVLKKFNVDSPEDLDDDKKKEFFNYIEKNWKKEKVNETVQRVVLGESVEEQPLDEIFGFFEKRSAAEVAAAAKESEKRKKEYEKRNARVKAVGYDKLADMIGDNMSLIGYPDPSEFYDMKVKWSQLYDDVYTGKKEYDQKETYDVVAPILKKQQAFWNKRKSRFDNNASGIRSVLKQGK